MRVFLRTIAAFFALVTFSISEAFAGTSDREAWMEYLAAPSGYTYEKSVKLLKVYRLEDFDVELLVQTNGPGTQQRVMKAIPKNSSGKCPAVVVPFYFPEAMLGFDPETMEPLSDYVQVAMMSDLARRGYITICAESYHLTYIDSPLGSTSLKRWAVAGEKLIRDWPGWTGMGKLLYDTELLVDLLEVDPRVDAGRIGIAGHSLGGKIAFYAGCLDNRIKVMMLSDFGFLWDQSNWEKVWYWGDKLSELKQKGMDHISLLGLSSGKPVILLAGKYDNEDSEAAMRKARGYRGKKQSRIVVVNHATGHRPPSEVLESGYDFLDKWLFR